MEDTPFWKKANEVDFVLFIILGNVTDVEEEDAVVAVVAVVGVVEKYAAVEPQTDLKVDMLLVMNATGVRIADKFLDDIKLESIFLSLFLK